jgi:DNA-binding beta-propeller fold protein YncE
MKISIYILSIILISSFFSCSNNVGKKEDLLFFPLPPEEPKIQFLKVIKGSFDITGQRSGFENFILGEDLENAIAKPYGITSSKDRILLVDTKLQSLVNLNLKNHKFEYITPSGKGSLKNPLNCFLDNEMIYINDISSKDIVVLDKNNEFKTRFGKDIFLKPTDVCVYQNKIYVSDMDSNKIFVFSKDNYQLLTTFPNVSQESDEFLHSPTQITIQNDKIYINDFGEFHIKVFDLNGKYLRSIGSYGQNLGQFVRPKGIAVDQDDNVFVVDAAFENVQMFNPDGKLLMFFGGPYISPGYLILPIRIAIDYDNIDYFKELVDSKYKIKYLIYVTNQFGPDKITVYGFLEPKI